MSDHLPHELVREFLSWLPVKSLLRFRCVSKAWNSLITSPSFITQHLNKTTMKKGELLLFRYSSKEMGKNEQFFLYPNESFPLSPIEELDCAFKVRRRYVNIVGSCDGVVCLSDSYDFHADRASLWNPSVRKTLSIPINNFKFKSHEDFLDYLGFGFDSLINDYKLVRVVYVFDPQPLSFALLPLVEVYTLRSGHWRMVHNDLEYVIRGHSAFVKGACHWIGLAPRAKKYQNEKRNNVIVLFDLGKEVFGEMVVPYSLEHCEVGIVVLDEALVLVPLAKEEVYTVWMMKEYGVAESWTKLFNIEISDIMPKCFAFRYNGKVLLGKNDEIKDDGELVLYDLETKRCSSDPIFKGKMNSFYLDTFVESLILLGEADEVAEEDADADEVAEEDADYASFLHGLIDETSEAAEEE